MTQYNQHFYFVAEMYFTHRSPHYPYPGYEGEKGSLIRPIWRLIRRLRRLRKRQYKNLYPYWDTP